MSFQHEKKNNVDSSTNTFLHSLTGVKNIYIGIN